MATTFKNGLNVFVACTGVTLVIKLQSVTTKNSYIYACHEFCITENGNQEERSPKGVGMRNCAYLVQSKGCLIVYIKIITYTK